MDTAIDLPGLAKALSGEVSNGQVKAPGPGHSSQDRSLSIKLDPSAQDGFIVHSFASDDPIKCRDYVKQKIGLPAWEPKRQINSRASAADIQRNLMQALASQREEAPKRQIVKTYDYCDADGTLLYQVCRLEPKDFRQRRPDGNGGWKWGLEENQRRVLYRLPEFASYPTRQPSRRKAKKTLTAFPNLATVQLPLHPASGLPIVFDRSLDVTFLS
jgi:hypothetical protein